MWGEMVLLEIVLQTDVLTVIIRKVLSSLLDIVNQIVQKFGLATINTHILAQLRLQLAQRKHIDWRVKLWKISFRITDHPLDIEYRYWVLDKTHVTLDNFLLKCIVINVLSGLIDEVFNSFLNLLRLFS